MDDKSTYLSKFQISGDKNTFPTLSAFTESPKVEKAPPIDLENELNPFFYYPSIRVGLFKGKLRWIAKFPHDQNDIETDPWPVHRRDSRKRKKLVLPPHNIDNDATINSVSTTTNTNTTNAITTTNTLKKKRKPRVTRTVVPKKNVKKQRERTNNSSVQSQSHFNENDDETIYENNMSFESEWYSLQSSHTQYSEKTKVRKPSKSKKKTNTLKNKSSQHEEKSEYDNYFLDLQHDDPTLAAAHLLFTFSNNSTPVQSKNPSPTSPYQQLSNSHHGYETPLPPYTAPPPPIIVSKLPDSYATKVIPRIISSQNQRYGQQIAYTNKPWQPIDHSITRPNPMRPYNFSVSSSSMSSNSKYVPTPASTPPPPSIHLQDYPLLKYQDPNYDSDATISVQSSEDATDHDEFLIWQRLHYPQRKQHSSEHYPHSQYEKYPLNSTTSSSISTSSNTLYVTATPPRSTNVSPIRMETHVINNTLVNDEHLVRKGNDLSLEKSGQAQHESSTQYQWKLPSFSQSLYLHNNSNNDNNNNQLNSSSSSSSSSSSTPNPTTTNVTTTASSPSCSNVLNCISSSGTTASCISSTFSNSTSTLDDSISFLSPTQFSCIPLIHIPATE